jgi:hypothetical protein
MTRLCVLLCALLLAPGCAGDGQKGQWDEFWKDLRGDNMQMRGDSWGRTGTDEQPRSLKPRD